jgi:hypothetical protein
VQVHWHGGQALEGEEGDEGGCDWGGGHTMSGEVGAGVGAAAIGLGGAGPETGEGRGEGESEGDGDGLEVVSGGRGGSDAGDSLSPLPGCKCMRKGRIILVCHAAWPDFFPTPDLSKARL